jgi:hypothetical protein
MLMNGIELMRSLCNNLIFVMSVYVSAIVFLLWAVSCLACGELFCVQHGGNCLTCHLLEYPCE